jgi:hypothetical protein
MTLETQSAEEMMWHVTSLSVVCCEPIRIAYTAASLKR